jgi:hypothetical protein
MMSVVVKLEPTLAKREDLLGGWMMENLSRGAAAEFCFGRLMWELEEEGRDSLPTRVLAWPRDEMCVCGRSLSPGIYCCDQDAPFSMAIYPDLAPEFVLIRPCCDQFLRGFQCDACGRVHSWEAGIQDSHRSGADRH